MGVEIGKVMNRNDAATINRDFRSEEGVETDNSITFADKPAIHDHFAHKHKYTIHDHFTNKQKYMMNDHFVDNLKDV